jgi:hypothetical protein
MDAQTSGLITVCAIRGFKNSSAARRAAVKLREALNNGDFCTVTAQERIRFCVGPWSAALRVVRKGTLSSPKPRRQDMVLEVHVLQNVELQSLEFSE